MMNQRTLVALVATMLPVAVVSEALVGGLLDPSTQAMFEEELPNPLDPNYMFEPAYFDDGEYHNLTVAGCESDSHEAGLVNGNGDRLTTSIYGYKGDDGECLWPGKTFEAQTNSPLFVKWENNLVSTSHVLTSLNGSSTVDTSLHWAYSGTEYEGYSIESDGVPMVTHVHGAHTSSASDGDPDAWFTKSFKGKKSKSST
jgi:spore coat protein A